MGSEHGLARLPVALAPLADQVVDAGHEGVEMGAGLPLFRCVGEEEVHQDGLAATGRSPEVEALYLRRPAEHSSEWAALAEVLLQPGQGLDLVSDLLPDARLTTRPRGQPEGVHVAVEVPADTPGAPRGGEETLQRCPMPQTVPRSPLPDRLDELQRDLVYVE